MGVGSGRTRQQGVLVSFKGMNKTYYNGQYIPDASGPDSLNLYDKGWMSDEQHAMALMPLARRYNLDIGGNMVSSQIRHDYPSSTTMIGSGPADGPGIARIWEGPVIAYPLFAERGFADMSNVFAHRDQILDSAMKRYTLGTTAISRVKPASPQASMGVFLGELVRDGIPSLLLKFSNRSNIEFFRAQGNNYLNAEFGWRPFVSDLTKTAHALNNQAKILEDLQRNSGRAIRRRYHFPTEEGGFAVPSSGNYPWPILTPYHYSQQNVDTTLRDTKKTWFSGEFVYRYPPVNSSAVARARGWARQIIGVDLTPETLWNLAPWTWFGDWFANVGDFMANISAMSEEDLVMRYGYLMQETERVIEHTHYGLSTPYGHIDPVIRGRTVYTVKSRVGASPFGFGLTWDDFSPKQVAIMAALGITQSGRK